MPPVIAAAAAIAVATLGFRFLKREWQRVNRDLEAEEARPVPVRTLRRDPRTGEWREM